MSMQISVQGTDNSDFTMLTIESADYLPAVNDMIQFIDTAKAPRTGIVKYRQFNHVLLNAPVVNLFVTFIVITT